MGHVYMSDHIYCRESCCEKKAGDVRRRSFHPLSIHERKCVSWNNCIYKPFSYKDPVSKMPVLTKTFQGGSGLRNSYVVESRRNSYAESYRSSYADSYRDSGADSSRRNSCMGSLYSDSSVAVSDVEGIIEQVKAPEVFGRQTASQTTKVVPAKATKPETEQVARPEPKQAISPPPQQRSSPPPQQRSSPPPQQRSSPPPQQRSKPPHKQVSKIPIKVPTKRPSKPEPREGGQPPTKQVAKPRKKSSRKQKLFTRPESPQPTILRKMKNAASSLIETTFDKHYLKRMDSKPTSITTLKQLHEMKHVYSSASEVTDIERKVFTTDVTTDKTGNAGKAVTMNKKYPQPPQQKAPPAELFCASLVPSIERLDGRAQRLAKIAIQQILLELG